MRLALVQDGVVAEILLADEGWQAPEGFLAVPSDDANIGDLYDGNVFVPASVAPQFSERQCKLECGRRIYAIASDNAQKNMLAAIAAGMMSESDKATFNLGVQWIADMQERSRLLIAAAEPTFADDAHWPEVPAGVAELASRY